MPLPFASVAFLKVLKHSTNLDYHNSQKESHNSPPEHDCRLQIKKKSFDDTDFFRFYFTAKTYMLTMKSILITLLLTACSSAAANQHLINAYHQKLKELQPSDFIQQKRLTAQPQHRIWLDRRRTYAVRSNDWQKRDGERVLDTSDEDESINSSDVENIDEIKSDTTEADTNSIDADNIDNQNLNSNQDESNTDEADPTSPLLTIPWWTRIHEDYGSHSFNFIPESRRAASSVVYCREIGRGLADAAGGGGEDAVADEGDGAVVDDGDGDKSGVGDGVNATDNFGNATEIGALDANAILNISSIEPPVTDSNETFANDSSEETDTNNNAADQVSSEGIEIESGSLNMTKNNSSITSEEALPDKDEDATILDKLVDGSTKIEDTTNLTEVVMDKLTNATTTNSNQTSQQNQNTKQQTYTPKEEYIILSGGYTDHDWKTFPVYAFPLSSSIATGSGTWIDLSPMPNELVDNHSESWCKSRDDGVARDRLFQEAKYLKPNSNGGGGNGTSTAGSTGGGTWGYTADQNPWLHADPCAPTGRMGHSSFIHKNYLYVFGGLIYDSEQQAAGSKGRDSFRLEDVPYVYRLDLEEMFMVRDERRRAQAKSGVNSGRERQENNGSERRAEDVGLIEEIESLFLQDDDDTIDTIEEMQDILQSIHDVPPSNYKVKGWQRIIPRVKPFESLDGMPTMAASEVLLKSINRGEMQGGMWGNKYVMYGGLRIVLSDSVAGAGPHHSSSKVMKGSYSISSGTPSATSRARIIELPLGDVWAYDLELDAFEKITNSFGKPEGGDDVDEVKEKEFEKEEESNDDDDSWWSHLDASMFPRPRTAHAATVVGDELVIHGGMGWDEHVDDWDGSTNWETLNDMWILNLKTMKWKRRWMFPLLVRSYHSLVGWHGEDRLMGWGEEFLNFTDWKGPVVAAFGGFTNGIDVFTGEEVAYVFDDVLVSYPPPIDEDNFGVSSLWLKADNPDKQRYTEMISNRFEHAAVMSREGSMFVWGGQFEDTSMVKGVWMMNVAGKDSEVNFLLAEEDGIYSDYEATLTALHTIVLMMMFLSMTFTLLLGLTQRYNELIMQQTNGEAALRALEDMVTQDFAGDVAPTYTRGRGLHPQIISTLPEKVYRSSNENNDSTTENDFSEEEHKDEECCPICLVEYQDGDILRVLPCQHEMHKSCVDVWLSNNPSCPSCRHSLSELVDDRPMMQLRALHSRLANRTVGMRRFRNYHSAWTQDSPVESENENSGIEMIMDGPVLDIRFISSLELIEEGSDNDGIQEGSNANGVMDVELANMSRRSQRERTSRLARLRRNVARMRRERRYPGSRSIPLAEPLDEEPEISIT